MTIVNLAKNVRKNSVYLDYMKKITQFFRWVRRRKWWLLGAASLLVVLIMATPVYAVVAARSKTFSAATVPPHDVAIIFGAGVQPDHQPTPFLTSRLLAGAQLYKTGKANVLLVSGDNRTSHYDEPTAMRNYLVKQGVPSKAIVLDYAGRDTYDTCYRAHAIFGLQSAILVTHGYHLPRALMTCNALGVRSVGVKADRPGTSYSRNYWGREVLSLNKAAVQTLFKVKPGVLGPEEPGVAAASL
jgi:vancomycin permeability regulator SanA